MDIGIVTLYYNEDGSFQTGDFKPEGITVNPDELLDRLAFTDGEDQDTTVRQSQMILAMWFDRNNHIELANREHTEIVSKILECEKWTNGNVHVCKIEFKLKQRETVH